MFPLGLAFLAETHLLISSLDDGVWLLNSISLCMSEMFLFFHHSWIISWLQNSRLTDFFPSLSSFFCSLLHFTFPYQVLWRYYFIVFWHFLQSWKKVKMLVSQSSPTPTSPTFCIPMDASLPGSSVTGILQVRLLEWDAISYSIGSSWPGGWIWVCCFAGRFFAIWTTRETLQSSIFFWGACYGFLVPLPGTKPLACTV